LSDANLNGANLNGANLNYATLSGASINNATLNGSNLIEADLSRADLSGSQITDANLSSADLSSTNLINAQLKNAQLKNAQLKNAQLKNAQLKNAQLKNAQLKNAQLKNAQLKNAQLNYAQLNYADLDNAHLNDANMSDANMSDANLNNVNMNCTYLNCANLYGADLSHALLKSAVLTNIDMSQTKGLETVRHRGPSSVGVDTLFLSNGTIPLVFLRGCDVPEALISCLPSIVHDICDFCSCFIIYNKEDHLFAHRLHGRLQGKGIHCWLYQQEWDQPHDWMGTQIRGQDKVLFCASENSLTSRRAQLEISWVLHNRRKQIDETQQYLLTTLFLLDLDGHLFSERFKSGSWNNKRDCFTIDFTKWLSDTDEFESQFERVVKALRTDGGKKPGSSSRP
jgi:uncharacterized protein YjbI with pentapeptide repeats